MEINLPASINTEQLVESMIDSMPELQLRVFVNALCDRMQILTFDEALLADRLHAVMPFTMIILRKGMKNLLISIISCGTTLRFKKGN